MRHRTNLYLAAAILPIGVALAGCSTGPAVTSSATAPAAPNAGLTNARLHSAFADALSTATALRATGHQTGSSTNDELDYQPSTGGHCDESGTVAIDSAPVTFRIVGGVKYVLLDSSAVTASGEFTHVRAPESSYLGKWVSSSSALGTRMTSPFTEARGSACLGSMANPTTVFSPAGVGTVNGQAVAQYRGKDGSLVSVTLNGPARPVRIIWPGSGGGEFDLTWNHVLTITAPPTAAVLTSMPS